MKQIDSIETEKLFLSDPFSHAPTDIVQFQKSFKENLLFHCKHNEFTKWFMEQNHFDPESINDETSLSNVPGVMVNLYKEFYMASVPKEEIILELTSSGTSGIKSYQRLNEYSLNLVKRLAYKIHESLGITSHETYNYLCFTYDPKVASDVGTAFTDELLTNFTKKGEVYYAFEWNEAKKDFELNIPKIISTLKRFESSPLATRILGFPAFLWEILEENNLTFQLGNDSWVQTGGGWKGKSDQMIPKGIFREKIAGRLGIPEQNMRDLFGMVEHGIPYVDCEYGNLHIPNYARVFIRSPKDLSEQSLGQTGLLHFLCSYNFSYPAPSLLTTDYGYLRDDCKCGRGWTLHFSGRAGKRKHQGCAFKATSLLKS
ncbi:MAG: hypothetical protein QE271_10410 [Bacteriovoracaceae bacterium]|nr:hypothetical protein [Bacteriovoracaceae bacterium]